MHSNARCAIAVILTVLISGACAQNLIGAVLKFLALGQDRLDQEIPDQKQLYESYDFIIVGAGSAGCVLANRLSENPAWRVLLIEAGGRENLLMDIPQFVHFLQQLDVNWGYKTEPSDKYCLGMNNNQCNWPRGKVMGGSSVLNYMIYTRGNRRDYDRWAALGNVGWDFNSVLPYFKKLENAEIYNSTPAYRGKGGPITVSSNFWKSEIARDFLQAGVEDGANVIDYNGPTQVGVSYIQSNLKNGFRESTNVAYLYPIRGRKNLHVKKNSLVTKLIIDKNSKRVMGVRFLHKGKQYSVKAKKEVIVSAGAINSPQLLMLSGIGPADHLQEMGIKPFLSLPVGYNLMDHIAPGGITVFCNCSSEDFFEIIGDFPNTFGSFMDRAGGPISQPGGCESLLFYDSNDPKNPDGFPDIELLQLGGSMNAHPSFRYNFGIKPQIWDKMYEDLGLRRENAFMVFPMILRPKSKGWIRLKSRDPLKYPRIIANYFADYEDVRVAIKGIRKFQEMIRMPAFQKQGARFQKTILPGCERFQYDSDPYWECYARHMTFTIYHYSGTCKMGPANDPTAVVDPRLKVHGMRNLRVVDASIMPEIMSGHPNGPVIMIAEKAADMIKEDWGVLQKRYR